MDRTAATPRPQDPDSAAPVRRLSEDDLELIDALQIDARAPWSRLGALLDVDAVTVSRRWERLTSAGRAWSTAALGPRQLHTMAVAFLELGCEAGAAVDVAADLVDEGHLITVQHMAGSCDLWVIAVAETLPQLSEHLLTDLPRRPGVRQVRTHVATRVFDASRRWRLRVLPRASAAALSPGPVRPLSDRPMDDLDRRLFLALTTDGRASHTALAEQVGATARTVQRRIARLRSTGDVDFRCDLARPLAGWHASAVLMLEVPDDALEATGRALLGWPETRTCAAVVGPANLLLTLGLHAVADLHALVTRLSREFPHARVVDRQMVLRQTKLYGHVVDEHGRSLRAVPVDPWALGRRAQGR